MTTLALIRVSPRHPRPVLLLLRCRRRVYWRLRFSAVESAATIHKEVRVGKSLALWAVGLLLLAVCPLFAAEPGPAGKNFSKGGVAPAVAKDADTAAASSGPEWAMNATIIEACSCPMFCQCYFDTKPAAHGAHEGHAGHEGHGDAAGGEHYCKFNNAYRVNTGLYGNTKLDGIKFWIGGDLGGDFSQGKMDWAVLTFDPAVTKAQREGVKAIMAYVYPVKWGSFDVAADAPVEWRADKDKAVARLDNGKAGEIRLTRWQGMSEQPIVIQNLKYWGTPRNQGFLLMPNEVEALRKTPEGKQPFEFKGSNG